MIKNVPTKKDFWFLPLGGSGEIGMNLNLYGHDGQWLMLDLGITFGDRFGIDIITPDPTFIVENRDRLAGIVITHAHEDHVGAVPYLWPLLRKPLYATPFTASIIRQKIKEYSWAKEVEIIEVPLSSSLKVGPFDLEFITLTHSIPEPNAVAITTPLGTVMHTGDWKIDPAPLVGGVTDHAKLVQWGNKGVLAMMCDSTNVFTQGSAGSEEAVRNELIEIMSHHTDKRITVACFASNLARLETAAVAAKVHGRKVALVGRSFGRMLEAAHSNGYLLDLDAFIDADKAMALPPEKVLLISTGSQGEARSALARIASDQHPEVDLGENDVVIFSSRVIPGNEKTIGAMQNNLIRKGIKLITSHEAEIHVSGHPGREELRQMYEWVRPQILVPVHGEMRHMQEQADFALECGVPQVLVPENGTLIKIDTAHLKVIDIVPTGRWGYDGNRMIPMINPILRDRARLAVNGAIVVVVELDTYGQMKRSPIFSIIGICEGEEREAFERDLHKAIREAVVQPAKGNPGIKENIRIAVRRTANHHFAKKPVTEVHLIA